MPGMRPLAALTCPECGGSFFCDFPTGDAWYGMSLIDRDTGQVFADRDDFMTTWLRRSYANPTKEVVDVDVDQRREIEHPAVLNCLDALFGHSLLKLLSAQHFIEEETVDLIVIVPRILSWCVPEGVAAVWEVDVPMKRGFQWNEFLAGKFSELLEQYELVDICQVPPHPSPETFDIHRFTGVEPFRIEQWVEPERRVTFVWREDRFWAPHPPAAIVKDWLGRTGWSGLGSNVVVAAVGEMMDGVGRIIQRRRIRQVARDLRDRYPDMEFVVAGIGTSGAFPSWIDDQRVDSPDSSEEQALCEYYSRSHVVVGVHGSNMLLPSAHAGAVVDLMPSRRWGNMGQDLIIRRSDARRTMMGYHLLPLATPAATVAKVVGSILESGAGLSVNRSE